MNKYITLLLFLGIILTGCKSSNIEISIHNISSKYIYDVQIHYTDGIQDIAKVKPYSKEMITIQPTHDSGLRISYMNSDNQKINQIVDTYFSGGGYQGKIEIFVNQNAIDHLKNNIIIK